MATVIDSLVLELGIDPKKFTQGQRDALQSLRTFEEEAEKQGKRVEAQTKRLNDVMGNFKRELLTTAAVFFGGMGIKEFTGFITNLDASTSRLGKTVNMTAGEMSAWQGAFQQVGGSAESANGAITGLGGEMQRFVLTGQSSMLPVLSRLGLSLFDGNKQLKTAGQLWLEIADAVKDMKDTEKASFAGMIPGANQDMINLIIKGRPAIEAYLRAAREAGGTTKESAAAAEEYQRSLAGLDRSATNLGRTLTTMLAPALTTVFDAMAKGLQSLKDTPAERAARDKKDLAERGGVTTHEEMVERFGEAPRWLKNLFGVGDEPAPDVSTEGLRKRFGAPPAAASGAAEFLINVQGTDDAAHIREAARNREAYIREAARKRGIDPDIAVRVARSEGLGGAYAGDRGSSFGDFQLHYGGMAGGGMAVGGLGDEFTRKTGLDAKDPSTWRQQADFALDQARKQGWGAWHGWKGLPYAGISPGAVGAPAAAVAASGGGPAGAAAGTGNNTTVTTTIGQVQVNAPQARDANDIAHHIGPALDRVITAGAANVGPE